MGRRLRYIPEDGSLVEVTSRTIQGRFLLLPTAELRSIVIGVLARAQRLYPVSIHAFVFLSNHYHLLLSVQDTLRLSQFMNYLNSNLAREAGRIHRWKEKFWGRRYLAIVVSREDTAQVARLRYILSHGCKEGLVSRPQEWPGAHSASALATGQVLEGLWFNRSEEYAARVRGERFHRLKYAVKETVDLSPLPCWAQLPLRTVRNRVRELIDQIGRRCEEECARTGIRPLGADRILKQHPHDRPLNSKRAPAPRFHAATKAARRELIEAYQSFVASFREASRRLREGNRNAKFPVGSFPPGLPFVSAWLELEPG